MSYSIDIYRRATVPVKEKLDLFLFIFFFPQIIAGPIVRAIEFLPQLNQSLTLKWTNIREGFLLFLQGIVKKVLLADLLARYVDKIFLTPGQFSSLECILAVYAFAFQIYWDFSGYTDMALGIGKVFGLKLPVNFNRPYIATSLRNFWQRWHITLSSWLRDYLYIPLGGSRKKRSIVFRNLLITMFLGGLWHGAAWRFVFWGLFHGFLLVLERIPLFKRLENLFIPVTIRPFLKRLVVFNLVCVGWIFFRAPNMQIAKELLYSILNMNFSFDSYSVIIMFSVTLFFIWEILAYLCEKRAAFQEFLIYARHALLGVALPLSFVFSVQGSPFIYFQF